MKLFGRDFRFITIVGWLLGALSLVYGFLIGAWILLLEYGYDAVRGIPTNYKSEFGHQLMLILILFGPALLCLVTCVWILWLCRKRGLDINGHWRISILVLLVAILGGMSIDSSPIKMDYTTADILIKGRDVDASYQTLMKYFKKGNPLLNVVSPYDFCKPAWNIDTNVIAYGDAIEKAWNDNSEARAVVDTLSKYDVIADLVSGVSLDRNIPLVSFVALRNLLFTYRFHCLLKTEKGDSVEAARQLARFHSVGMTAYKNASLLVPKMCFNAIVEQDIQTAHQIIQHSNCTPETVNILADAFPTIPGKDVSLRSPMICEYLIAKNICETYPSDRFLDVYIYRWHGEESGLIRRNISRFLFCLTFKRNATVRMLKFCFEPTIEGASKCRMQMPDTEMFAQKHFSYPRLNNIGGWIIIHAGSATFQRAADSVSRTKVLSDLLAIELHKRLGEPIDIPDFYSGKPYFVDAKTGKLASVGPDGIAGTKDDIQLGQSF